MVQIAAPLNGNGSHAIEHLMIWQTDEHKTKKIKELSYIYPNTTILNSFSKFHKQRLIYSSQSKIILDRYREKKN